MDGVRGMIAVSILACACFVFSGAGAAAADERPDLNQEESLYSDVKAHRIGDVLSVIISESNSARNDTRTSTKKQDKANAKGSATTGALKGLFPGVGGSLSLSNQFEGRGGTQRNGSFSARMSVKVVDVLPGGLLVVEGTKTMEINEELEVVTLSGTVRPEDISSSNTVYSYQIANAKLSYKGKGTSSEGHRPGLLFRLINWLL